MSTTVNVGGQEFVLDRVSAAQVAGFLRIASRLSMEARKSISNVEDATDTDFLWAILGSITEDDLLSLAALSIGVDKKFAEDNFDLAWVVTAVIALIQRANIGSVIANFTSALSQVAD